MPPTPDTMTVHPWLAGFRPPDRPMVRAWFAYTVSQGARRPEAIVEMVHRVVVYLYPAGMP